ncbi:hypothetical protein JMG10_30490 [Nostoc ellipsosporum NOK]|nr:hypothetical protein [Nostoc ellipsosporum NOK]OSZ68524.1 hypothetical protein CAP40_08055 [Sphingomonas sp. IBVSS2]
MPPGYALLVTAIAVPAADWLMVTGSAAKMVSFDYVYWPPSRLRIIGIVLLAAGLFTTLVLVRPPESNAGLWKLLPVAAALVVHVAIAMRDLLAQRRAAQGRRAEADAD